MGDGSAVKRTWFQFNKHPLWRLTVLGDLMLFSGTHMMHRHASSQDTHTHKVNNKKTQAVLEYL